MRNFCERGLSERDARLLIGAAAMSLARNPRETMATIIGRCKFSEWDDAIKQAAGRMRQGAEGDVSRARANLRPEWRQLDLQKLERLQENLQRDFDNKLQQAARELAEMQKEINERTDHL